MYKAPKFRRNRVGTLPIPLLPPDFSLAKFAKFHVFQGNGKNQLVGVTTQTPSEGYKTSDGIYRRRLVINDVNDVISAPFRTHMSPIIIYSVA